MPVRGPLYEEAHVYVAAVRVLAHKTGRPPTVEEVAELIGESREAAYHLARALKAKGILRMMENPFETHLEIEDHLAIEKLPREETGPGIAEDLEEFHEKKKKEHETMGDFFKSDAAGATKKKKLSKMEEEFLKFRRKHEEEE